MIQQFCTPFHCCMHVVCTPSCSILAEVVINAFPVAGRMDHSWCMDHSSMRILSATSSLEGYIPFGASGHHAECHQRRGFLIASAFIHWTTNNLLSLKDFSSVG
jgi:hypothetical protein